jgi:hypothetical protein
VKTQKKVKILLILPHVKFSRDSSHSFYRKYQTAQLNRLNISTKEKIIAQIDEDLDFDFAFEVDIDHPHKIKIGSFRTSEIEFIKTYRDAICYASSLPSVWVDFVSQNGKVSKYIINGRGKIYKYNFSGKLSLFFRKFLNSFLVFEVFATVIFLFVTPVLLLLDFARFKYEKK